MPDAIKKSLKILSRKTFKKKWREIGTGNNEKNNRWQRESLTCNIDYVVSVLHDSHDFHAHYFNVEIEFFAE